MPLFTADKVQCLTVTFRDYKVKHDKVAVLKEVYIMS